MRPATDRVADREKRTAASRPPLKLRRACWRSVPEPQEEFILKKLFGGSRGTLSVATGGSSQVSLRAKEDCQYCRRRFVRRQSARRRSSPQRGSPPRAALILSRGSGPAFPQLISCRRVRGLSDGGPARRKGRPDFGRCARTRGITRDTLRGRGGQGRPGGRP